MTELRGLQRLCKLYGRMKCGDVTMMWDYANECALPEAELKADTERWAASERAKYQAFREQSREVDKMKFEQEREDLRGKERDGLS